MPFLPRVAETTRERVHRDFDDRGVQASVESVTQELNRNNPEILDIVVRCAADLGNPDKVLLSFGLFYRTLLEQSGVGRHSVLSPLPRVSPETRDDIVREIEHAGTEAFTAACVNELEAENPELLLLAHDRASNHGDYLGMMQGFILIYRTLAAEAVRERSRLH